MPARLRLSSADRDFCTLVARAAFTNPFGEEFPKLYRLLGGTPNPHDARRDAAEAVARRLERAGLARLDRWSGEERERMQVVFLFDAYQRFYDSLEELVAQQISAVDTPVEVPFARDLLGLLRQRGFPAGEALRYFAIFFQIRRAAHFIEHGLIGRSPCMKELRRQLWQHVFTHDMRRYERHLWNRMEDFSTMLLGETGTGKGTAAAAIGRSGF